jgi:glycosyltransferase involved in cell wall biosynthesis
MILAGLNGARRVACISEATRHDVLRLTRLPASKVDLVYMGLNYNFRPMELSESGPILERLLGTPRGVVPEYLMHVGGNQWYKNRLGLLKIYDALRRAKPDCPALVLVGEPISSEMAGFIAEHRLGEKVKALEKAGNEEVRALYSTARCMVFPSLAEGFGWPIVEAQACGCPVATSNRAPMTEVGGAGALYLDPGRPDLAAAELAKLLAESSEQRAGRVRQGLANAARFSTETMVGQYLGLYAQLAGEGS